MNKHINIFIYLFIYLYIWTCICDYVCIQCFQEHPKGMTDPSSIRRAQLGLLSTAGGGKHTHLTQWSLHRYVYCLIIYLHLIWTNVLVFVLLLLYIYMYTDIIDYGYMYVVFWICMSTKYGRYILLGASNTRRWSVAASWCIPPRSWTCCTAPRGGSPGAREVSGDLGSSWWMR